MHCDVKIFEWLIKYVDYLQNYNEYGTASNLYRSYYQIVDDGELRQNNAFLINYKPPVIEVKNCVSILISADFLIMKELVEETVQYLAQNLAEILKLPIDMLCIND